jgi:uncharacterized protein (TIGR02145 family)
MKRLLTALALTSGLFAGCGSSNGTTGPSSPSGSFNPVLARGTFTDARDGHIYGWIRITDPSHGETLDVTTSNLAYRTGFGDSIYRNATIDSASSLARWGVWYNWRSLTNGQPSLGGDGKDFQGACPEGWFVATSNDLGILNLTYFQHWVVPSYGGSYYERNFDTAYADSGYKTLLSKASGGWDAIGFNGDLQPFKTGFNTIPAQNNNASLKIGDTLINAMIFIGGEKNAYGDVDFEIFNGLSSQPFKNIGLLPDTSSYGYIRCVRAPQ